MTLCRDTNELFLPVFPGTDRKYKVKKLSQFKQSIVDRDIIPSVHQLIFQLIKESFSNYLFYKSN